MAMTTSSGWIVLTLHLAVCGEFDRQMPSATACRDISTLCVERVCAVAHMCGRAVAVGVGVVD